MEAATARDVLMADALLLCKACKVSDRFRVAPPLLGRKMNKAILRERAQLPRVQMGGQNIARWAAAAGSQLIPAANGATLLFKGSA